MSNRRPTNALLVIAALLTLLAQARPTLAETRTPLRATALTQLLPWIASSSVVHVSTDRLLANIEKAAAKIVGAKTPSAGAPPALTGPLSSRVAAFERWLTRAVPDAAAQGLVLRQALARALTKERSDGTELFAPNHYMLPAEQEGYDKGGVGLLVDPRPDPQGRFIVFELLDGFPGASVGLKRGDRLVAVGERSVIGLSYRELADLVRGPLGTRVKLTVDRPGEHTPVVYEVERVWLNPNPKNISHKVLPNGVGYVRVKYLGERMDLELSRVIDAFDKDGVKKIILDLRNNEGLLVGTQDVGGVFLGPRVEITRLVTRKGSEVRRTHGTQLTKAPVVVLVNRYTSGAGVLLAAALRQNVNARLVGEGTIWRDQPTVSKELSDGSTVTVASGYYILADGQVLRNRLDSLKLDAAVTQNPLEPFGTDSDAQLSKAVELSR